MRGTCTMAKIHHNNTETSYLLIAVCSVLYLSERTNPTPIEPEDVWFGSMPHWRQHFLASHAALCAM